MPYVNKIYRFMWRKGQLLQILSTHSAQHKIYRFIWRKWRFFFQVAKYGFFMAIFWPSNWPFCRNFWTRRCSFPQILWLSKKTCLRKLCEFYRFIWFHCFGLIMLFMSRMARSRVIVSYTDVLLYFHLSTSLVDGITCHSYICHNLVLIFSSQTLGWRPRWKSNWRPLKRTPEPVRTEK